MMGCSYLHGYTTPWAPECLQKHLYMHGVEGVESGEWSLLAFYFFASPFLVGSEQNRLDATQNMGLTVEMVRSVFSKNRSLASHHTNIRNVGADKRKWSVVRSYLCRGHECNSVLVEDDSTSARSSEATVTQKPSVALAAGALEEEQNRNEVEEHRETTNYEAEQQNLPPKECNSTQENAAAIIIQSAFRAFLARRQMKQLGKSEMETQSEMSLGTSIEVQTGGSVEDLGIRDPSMSSCTHKMQHKARIQVMRLEEEWDDSTVSSKILKTRIQNRFEAMTRRERALAYAFSQQLRTCSKRKSTRSNSSETNLGWNWLERWMATRQPENSSSVDDRLSKCLEPTTCWDPRSTTIKKASEVSVEEKESCGSNDVSVAFDRTTPSITATNEDNCNQPVKHRVKAARNFSRRKPVRSNTHSTKAVSKRECLKETDKEKKYAELHLPTAGEIKCKDATYNQAPSDH
ncbi:hypothetical protein ACLOJK_000700 [Asimina triloba]